MNDIGRLTLLFITPISRLMTPVLTVMDFMESFISEILNKRGGMVSNLVLMVLMSGCMIPIDVSMLAMWLFICLTTAVIVSILWASSSICVDMVSRLCAILGSTFLARACMSWVRLYINQKPETPSWPTILRAG